MVQPDAIVTASASIIVGIAFLVNLVEAQDRSMRRGFIIMVAADILLFILAAGAAVYEDLIPALPPQPKVWTWLFFFCGLGLLAVLVCLLPTRHAAYRRKESNPKS
jgi:ABC-type lipoprotein release transport system permease subunit